MLESLPILRLGPADSPPIGIASQDRGFVLLFRNGAVKRFIATDYPNQGDWLVQDLVVLDAS